MVAGACVGGQVEGLSQKEKKRERELRNMDNSVVTAGEGVLGVEEGINGDGSKK